MKLKTGVSDLQSFFKKIDWQLLLFLLLIMQVKLVFKVAGIIIIYLLQWNFNFGFKIKGSRLPLFYPAIIAIAFAGLLVNKSFTNINYDVAFIMGIGFWILCILAIHQIKLFVDRNDSETIDNTVIVFFILNAVISIGTILLIVFKTGAINPYLYQGEYQKYFISTGDYIKGITFNTSTTNAMLNAFGVIYFLLKRNTLMVLLCMTVMIFTASNFTSLILLAVFAGIFIFKSDANQKSVMVICFCMLVIFLGKVSPQNDEYVSSIFDHILPGKEKPQDSVSVQKINPADSLIALNIQHKDAAKENLIQKEIKSSTVDNKPLIIASIRANTRPYIPGPNINLPPYQQKNDTTDFRKELLHFMSDHKSALPLSSSQNAKITLPGKAIAFEQTINFIRHCPQKSIFGDGIGNFSSSLAFRTAGLNINGGYPAKLRYSSPEFLGNHLDVYLFFFSTLKGFHSIINSSDSVYDQLLSEYGILGISAFCIFYLAFFLRNKTKKYYLLPLVFLLLGFFVVGYWFEQLSVVIFFELLMFSNLKNEKNSVIPR